MAKQGLHIAHEIAPSTAGGPPRVEYELNEQGAAEYFRLLRDALSSHEQKSDDLSAGLGFIVDLPRGEATPVRRRTPEHPHRCAADQPVMKPVYCPGEASPRVRD